MRSPIMKKKIAIIGGGIAGLTSAYLLKDRHDITLYEKDDRLGGNAHTHRTHDGYEFDIAVAVFGKGSYKNFVKLLSKLDIKTKRIIQSFVSLHNLDTQKGLYFTPHSLKALKAQHFDMLRPRNLYAIISIFPNLTKGIKLMKQGKFDDLTMAEAMKLIPGLKGNAKLIFLFTLCIVTSMYYEEILTGPAKFFFQKIDHLKDFFSPRMIFEMNCAANKTKDYVNALASAYPDSIVLNSKIKRVERSENNITLKMADGKSSQYDSLIFACNADQALTLLEKPTDEEKRLLGPWKYKEGPIVVHRDYSSFPKRDLCQAFTFLYTDRYGEIHTSVNGSVWHEPGVPEDCPYISSQHPNFPIDKTLVDYKKVFRTPIFDHESVKTIKELKTLNGKINTYYCGSHFGYGLHEDAVTSAIDVARMLGADWDQVS